MSILLTASFGGLRLYLESIDRDVGRALVKHEPTRAGLAQGGGGFVVDDRGPRLSVVECSLVFCPVAGERPFLDRYREFLRLKDAGAQIFTHPVYGSYRARVGECRESIDTGAVDRISLSVEFVPDGGADPVVTVQAGVSAAAGAVSVRLTADQLKALYAELGETSTVADDAADAADRWADADGTTDPRTVLVELASLSARIDTEVEDLELASDLSRWQAYRSALILRDNLRGAAQAATQEVDHVTEVVLEVAIPLVVLMARLYGAKDATARADQVASLNGLGSRLLVPAGTRLRVPATEGR